MTIKNIKIKCQICNEDIDQTKFPKHIFHIHNTLSKDYYDKYIKKETDGFCKVCNKETKYYNIFKGYSKYCRPCANKDPEIRNKIDNTNLKIRDVKNPGQSKDVREKMKNTIKEKYGVDHYSKTDEYKKQYKETCQEKYGVDNVFQNEDIKEKSTQTIIKKYGVDNISKSKEIIDKINQTQIDKFGVKRAIQLDEYKEKRKHTNISIFGVDNPMYSNDIKEKLKQTMQERYGVDYPMQSKKIIETLKKNNLEKYNKEYYFETEKFKRQYEEFFLKYYNVDHYSKTDQYKKDYENTSLENFGTTNPLKNEEIKAKIKQSFFKKTIDRFRNSIRFLNFKLLFDESDYKGVDRNNKYKFECKLCNNIFEDHIDDGRLPRCLICNPLLIGSSKNEEEIAEFCKIYFPNLIKRDKSILNGREIDIFIPEINFGIEFHGLHWHSETFGQKDKHYHLNKYIGCLEKNIHLIQIFEDEWINQKEIVKSILLSKMNKLSNKIHARECIIKEIDEVDASLFLFDNHLQGSIYGIHYGLYHNDELVSIITIGKPRFEENSDIEIYRYCNKLYTNVQGGLSKLLSHVKKLNPEKSIITYSDKRYSNGNSYLKCGFKLIANIAPSYHYFDSNYNRYNRIKFQKHKLKKLLEKYDDNLTEWQNMQNNNYDRIWDCGNYLFKI